MFPQKWLVVFLIAALLIGSTPAGAQTDPPDLLDRAEAAFLELPTLQSFEAARTFQVSQSWMVLNQNQVLADVTSEFNRSDQITYIHDETPNARQRVHMENWVQNGQQSATMIASSAEMRAVDGVIFANGSYAPGIENSPALPGTWVRIEEPGDAEPWGGLLDLGLIDFAEYVPAGPDMLLIGAPAADMVTLIRAYAADATSRAARLPNGQPGELIEIPVYKNALPYLNLFDPTSGPANQIVFDLMDETPATLSLLLDSGDQLHAVDIRFEVSVNHVNLDSLPDTPQDTTLTLSMSIGQSLRLDSVNTTLLRVVEPEITPLASATAYSAPAERTNDLPWWNDRVFYEVFVRSFYDSDGDGIGDLRGLIEKLDYLNDGDPATTDDLGITGIWLMPVTQSPSYHGYDTTDYYTIESDYGTNDDFKLLMAEAEARGIAVIVDLMLNHTSNEHPWFEAAMEGDPEYESWYIWANDPPEAYSPWGTQVWHLGNGRYYFGMFWSGMPDLNYETPEVTAAMYDVIAFWLQEMDVDGFRLDAIRHLIEDGNVMANTPATLAWLENFDRYVHEIAPDAMMIGEIWDSTANVAPYVGERVDLAFEFDLAQAILNAANWGLNTPLLLAYSQIMDAYPTGQYAPFITNHDQNRVMSQLGEDVGAAKVAATLLLTGPGVPFIYYGEEVGMVGEKPDERIRTPMQWNDSTGTGGFSTLLPWQRMQANYKTMNVAAMTDDADSLLNHYRRLVHLRNEHAALRTGTMQLVQTGHDAVYAFLRYGENDAFLVVVNLGDDPVSDYALAVPDSLLVEGITTEVVLGEGTVTAPEIGANGAFADYMPLETLAPQSSLVIRLN